MNDLLTLAADVASRAQQRKPFRRHHDLAVAPAVGLQCSGQRPFRNAAAVQLRGIEPVDTAVERRLDDDVLAILRHGRMHRPRQALAAAELRHPEAYRRDLYAGLSKRSFPDGIGHKHLLELFIFCKRDAPRTDPPGQVERGSMPVIAISKLRVTRSTLPA